MNEQGDNCEFDLARSHFTSQVLGRSSDHLAGDKDSDDQEKQKIDHADALAAKYAIQPHPHHGRKAGQRIETVVCAVDRTTGDCGSQCSESRCGNGSKAELLALQVSKVLIKRETCDGRNSDLS